MKRKWLAIVGIAVLSINLCGCGGQESTTQTTDGKSVEAQTAGDVATAETTNKIVTTQETRIAYDDNDSDIASHRHVLRLPQ